MINSINNISFKQFNLKSGLKLSDEQTNLVKQIEKNLKREYDGSSQLEKLHKDGFDVFIKEPFSGDENEIGVALERKFKYGKKFGLDDYKYQIDVGDFDNRTTLYVNEEADRTAEGYKMVAFMAKLFACVLLTGVLLGIGKNIAHRIKHPTPVAKEIRVDSHKNNFINML